MYWAGQSRKRAFKECLCIKITSKKGVIALGTDFPVEEMNQCLLSLQLRKTVKDIRDGFRWKML
jgi:hypothetical protein